MVEEREKRKRKKKEAKKQPVKSPIVGHTMSHFLFSSFMEEWREVVTQGFPYR